MTDRLTKLARGRECQIRLPVCNWNPETVVLAHYRMAGQSGIGLKPHSFLGSWACSECHQYVDTHKDEITQISFLLGVLRTQAQILKEGHVK